MRAKFTYLGYIQPIAYFLLLYNFGCIYMIPIVNF